MINYEYSIINMSRRYDFNKAIENYKTDPAKFETQTYSKYDAEEIIDYFYEGRSLEYTLKDNTTGEEIINILKDIKSRFE